MAFISLLLNYKKYIFFIAVALYVLYLKYQIIQLDSQISILSLQNSAFQDSIKVYEKASSADNQTIQNIKTQVSSCHTSLSEYQKDAQTIETIMNQAGEKLNVQSDISENTYQSGIDFINKLFADMSK